MNKSPQKRKKAILTLEEKKLEEQKRQQTLFRNKIKSIYAHADFTYLKTDGINITLSSRTVEVDMIFVYKNIILICEDTISQKGNIEDHVRNKHFAFSEISRNFSSFWKQIAEHFPNDENLFTSYETQRYKISNLYFTKNATGFTRTKKNQYSNIIFIEPEMLEYFSRMAKCIKKSVRFEIFRFLELKNCDIGISSSQSSVSTIDTTIIAPEASTGLNKKFHLVSFMMSAQDLIETSYVLRKDNWEDTAWLYQRLIEPAKLKSIRKFVAHNKSAFINNIIVSLPSDVKFLNSDGSVVDLKTIDQLNSYKMQIPKEINSICIIDGQHRIYSHYEGGLKDKYEGDIASLRSRLHLLVTGLVFDDDIEDADRIQIESEIFLDINSTTTPVKPDVLLHIGELKDPFSDLSIARKVIKSLNEEELFFNKFEMTSLENGKIKIASIIKFALRYLVTVQPKSQETLYKYWVGEKNLIEKRKIATLDEYVSFICDNLTLYFKAVKKHYKDDWDDPASKLLTTITINGFIMAYQKQLTKNGLQDFAFYDEAFGRCKFDFSKEAFSYTASQYRMFSEVISEKLFE